jgi:hypothetical protein
MRIHVAPAIKILPKEFERFLREFAAREPVKELSLCRHLATESNKCAKNQAGAECYEPNLPRKGIEERAVGVYCIYAKQKNRAAFECFYVGISESNIYSRVYQHLRGDIRDKDTEYDRGKRNAYVWLENAVEVVICYATIQGGDNRVVRRRLRLLEASLTVLLRPKFLILASETMGRA